MENTSVNLFSAWSSQMKSVCLRIGTNWLSESIISLKELEHRKLGWKVFILKYDLGKTICKEMWCKIADTKAFIDYIF